MLGPGRPAKRPSIDAVRELTVEEVRSVPRARVPLVKQLRDSHHMVARLFAMGLRPFAVAERTGYSIARISILSSDPAMKELIASYRGTVDDEFRTAADEYFESAIAVRKTSMRMIRDRLEDADEKGEQLPLNQLVAIHADTADRTGYPKRKESVNLNIDFAERLEKAVKRSAQAKTIDHDPGPGPQLPLARSAPADGGRVAAAQGKRMDAPAPALLRLERRFG